MNYKVKIYGLNRNSGLHEEISLNIWAISKEQVKNICRNITRHYSFPIIPKLTKIEKS